MIFMVETTIYFMNETCGFNLKSAGFFYLLPQRCQKLIFGAELPV
jgi:hypothetical protein